MNKEEYLASLPKKRVASGCLIFNDKNEVLIVEPTYKKDWEIPGGMVELNESPLEALSREIKEELGVEVIESTLLYIEYQKQEFDDFIHFIFEVIINVEDINLNQEELKSFRFANINILKEKLVARLFNRIPKAIEAKKLGAIHYGETEV